MNHRVGSAVPLKQGLGCLRCQLSLHALMARPCRVANMSITVMCMLAFGADQPCWYQKNLGSVPEVHRYVPFVVGFSLRWRLGSAHSTIMVVSPPVQWYLLCRASMAVRAEVMCWYTTMPHPCANGTTQAVNLAIGARHSCTFGPRPAYSGREQSADSAAHQSCSTHHLETPYDVHACMQLHHRRVYGKPGRYSSQACCAPCWSWPLPMDGRGSESAPCQTVQTAP